MHKYIFLLLFSLIATSVTAQKQELLDQLKLLRQEVSDVDLGRYLYDQQLEYNPTEPTEITIDITETDTKRDKSESLSAVLNLALLNKNMVRRVSTKNEMKVVLKARKAIFQIYEEGEWDGYDNEFEIICQDIDAAKNLEKILEETIVAAGTYWKTAYAIPETVDDLIGMLTEAIGDVEIGESSIEQRMQSDKDYMDIMDMKQSKKSAMSYQFSLGDLEVKSVDYEIKSDKVFVEVNTAKDRKFILVEEEGELEYGDELQFFMSKPAQASQFVKLLKQAIPLCDSLIELRLPKPKDQVVAARLMQSLLIPYGFNETSYTQAINTDCRATYTISEEGEKETESLSYQFNWGDLDRKSKEIKLGKEQIEIALNMKGRNKYIEVRENDELKAFESSLSLYAPTVEAARSIISIVDSIIVGCPVELMAKNAKWLDRELAAITEIEEDLSQNLSVAADDPCQMTLTVNDKEDSEQYEFNLSDISMKSLELSIKGKTIELSMETKNDEESINYYDEKGDLSYKDELEFFFARVDAGRTALLTFKALGEGCKE
ncbi:MAG: hypothetical protein AAF806_26350 [Bacteroidota bacterium]